MSSFTDSATADFFRARLDHMIDLRHELAVLTSRMPWQQLEATLAHRLSRQAIAGKKLPARVRHETLQVLDPYRSRV